MIEAMKQALEALEMGLGQVSGDYDTAVQKAIGAVTALRTAIEQAEKQEPPPECQTEAEKRAYAFGWWKAMEANRAAQTRPTTREEKIVNPGVYEVLDTEARYKDVIEAVRKVWNDHRVKP